MSEYVLPNDTILVSRKYFITADISQEGETKPHNLNMSFEVDSVTQSPFFVGSDSDLIITIEEVNFNDPILPVRTYEAQEGIFYISPAILGGTETVSFQLNTKELYNGQPVGFNVPISGGMTVEIIN